MKAKILLLLLSAITFVCCTDNLDLKSDDEVNMELRSVTNGVEKYNYPAKDWTETPKFTVSIDNTEHMVYQYPSSTVKYNENTCKPEENIKPNIVSFGLQKDVTKTLIIKFPGKSMNQSNCKVSPKSRLSTSSTPNSGDHSISYKTDGSLALTITGPQMLCVEIDGYLTCPLLIFANEIETYIPQEGVNWFGKVHRFEAGTISNVNENGIGNGNKLELELESNDMVYIAPGAIVKGRFKTKEGATNVQIRGRGMVVADPSSKSLVTLNRVTGAYIEGITLVDCRSWVMALYGCENSTIDRVRVVSMTGHDDGIDLIGCTDTKVLNSFVMSKDDGIVIKAGCRYSETDYYSRGVRDVNNILIHNCMIWNGRSGSALEIGRNLNTGSVKNITYDYIHILHALGCTGNQNEAGDAQAAISIYNTGEAVVDNVIYKDIYIEHTENQLINFFVVKDLAYSPSGDQNGLGRIYDYKPGKIQNIKFQNIYVDKAGKFGSSFQSIGDRTKSANKIINITFQNFQINKTKITGYSTNDNNNQKLYIMTDPLQNFQMTELKFQ